jgi:hypothetical protein
MSVDPNDPGHFLELLLSLRILSARQTHLRSLIEAEHSKVRDLQQDTIDSINTSIATLKPAAQVDSRMFDGFPSADRPNPKLPTQFLDGYLKVLDAEAAARRDMMTNNSRDITDALTKLHEEVRRRLIARDKGARKRQQATLSLVRDILRHSMDRIAPGGGA